MKDLNVKQIVIIVVAAIVVVVTVGLYIYKMANKDEAVYDEAELGLVNDVEDEADGSADRKAEIYVHVTGCVKTPGIVILKEGSRIVDAIEAAGGKTSDADLNKLNLAYVLNDGDKLYVPSKKDKTENIEYITNGSGDNVITGGTGKMDGKSSLININTASKEELASLTGIGDATATKIIEYRKANGKFSKIEDIKNVPGIGDSKFENIKGSITV